VITVMSGEMQKRSQKEPGPASVASGDHGMPNTRWLFARAMGEPSGLIALAVTLFLVASALVGPHFVRWDPNKADYAATYQPPSRSHWFGTDPLGRDVLARVLVGAGISLRIAFVAAIINLLVGVSYGALAGYAGGRTDNLMMRFVDVLYGVPTILIVILLMVVLEKGIRNIYLAIGMTYWLNMARLVRAEVLSLKEREFVQAARALGARASRILTVHILPNTAGVVLVTLTLFVPEAIFTEAFLSYIGLGVPAPDASWGSLAAEGSRNLRAAPYLLFFPAAALCVTMLAFNTLGDAMRDALEGA
jgi:oligopeptide transport system permease protein